MAIVIKSFLKLLTVYFENLQQAQTDELTLPSPLPPSHHAVGDVCLIDSS